MIKVRSTRTWHCIQQERSDLPRYYTGPSCRIRKTKWSGKSGKSATITPNPLVDFNDSISQEPVLVIVCLWYLQRCWAINLAHRVTQERHQTHFQKYKQIPVALISAADPAEEPDSFLILLFWPGYLQTVQAAMILATILCCVDFFVFILQLFRLKQGERFVFTAIIQLLSGELHGGRRLLLLSQWNAERSEVTATHPEADYFPNPSRQFEFFQWWLTMRHKLYPPAVTFIVVERPS